MSALREEETSSDVPRLATVPHNVSETPGTRKDQCEGTRPTASNHRDTIC